LTLIIGIFLRDNRNNKDIIFASDGRAVKYEDNKKIDQYEDVEKIRKLTPKICMGYAGKNAELFEDVYKELKNKTPKKIKKELEPFTKRFQEIILKMLNTKKHKEIEKELDKHEQVYHKFIAGGLFNGTLTLIRLNSDDKYKLSIEEPPSTFSGVTYYVAGSTEEIQKETMAILDKKLRHIRSYYEIENIIRYTIFEIAKLYPDKINNHIFIRRLSKKFDLYR
jgi:20S proteasome alpha/beta subunit